ncbi:hypothetical protein QUB70_08270 [Microcoleus sp. A003_D6]|uniref:hypothetical protein n=1 Tax=Microcoleus sp. A003_D6 TaxID=3055266 RepID=UPI002FD58073
MLSATAINTNVFFCNFISRRKKEEGRGKKEEGRRKKEEDIHRKLFSDPYFTLN